MTKKEFTAWQAITESSRFKWTEDDIFRLNSKGNFYFIGGEDGQYIQIHKDGRLEVGTYEGAIPHIGEAVFETAYTKQCADYSEAFKTALEKVGGKKLLVDIFSPDDKNQIVREAFARLKENPKEDVAAAVCGKSDGRSVGQTEKQTEEYTSVMEKIKENKTEPKPPRKTKTSEKKKTKGGGAI